MEQSNFRKVYGKISRVTLALAIITWIVVLMIICLPSGMFASAGTIEAIFFSVFVFHIVFMVIGLVSMADHAIAGKQLLKRRSKTKAGSTMLAVTAIVSTVTLTTVVGVTAGSFILAAVAYPDNMLFDVTYVFCLVTFLIMATAFAIQVFAMSRVVHLSVSLAVCGAIMIVALVVCFIPIAMMLVSPMLGAIVCFFAVVLCGVGGGGSACIIIRITITIG
jgi:hypothetical protein